MEENNTKFKILDENNIEKEADVVTVIEVEGKELKKIHQVLEKAK